ncbi:PREDICTED: TNFAIP3-interacting protein 1 isoform X6 [Myotis davidii]|uniref:TNFAIP3-interacting protein 1 isoform X6 n=1 Tax=Myotis davidii TaxID=225400 RepID=UPI0007672F3F|nr:PREDICTED: TNFAIP3-interacting protein 1 isoform X6 [Myotis davidii]
MEGRGPYRIYDPGGSVPPGEASTAFERLVEENSRLKEKMQGIKMLGELLEESQMEASRLRQKAEALVQDSELGKDRQLLPPPSPTLTSFDHLPELTGKDANVPAPPADPAPPSDKPEPVPKPPSSGTSSEFEVVPNEQNSPPESGGQTRNMMELGPLPHEDSNLMLHLQRLETTLSVCAEEPDHSQLFTHLGRMALEFNRLASKVHKNEQRTSILQTLCEQLRKENETLKAKLDKGLEQRDQAAERLREENMELKKLLMTSGKEGVCRRPGSPKMEGTGKKGVAGQLQASATASKIPEAGSLGAAEKKVKMLEQQRTETNKEQLSTEAKELRQKVRYLQDQLSPLTRQRDYQEKEIQRLNKALEEALSIQASPSSPTAFGNPEGAGGLLRKQELVTQNELLKQQVKIFEEDFQRERSDRERMNEEKEELKKQVEKLQAQVTLSNAQLKAFKDEEKAKEALKQQKRKAKASAERYHVEPHPYFGYYGPPMPHHGYEEWSQIRYPPPPMAMEHPPPLPNSHLYPMPGYTWRPPYGGMRNQTSQVMDSPTARPAEPDSAKNDRKGPQ